MSGSNGKSNLAFTGWRRENGRVGVRNHVVILPLDDLSNAACEAVANNIKGTLAIPHAYGRLQFGEDLEVFFRTIIGTGANPNVAAVVVIGIEDGWTGRVVPTFRPDDVVDPDRPGFHDRLATLGELTGADTHSWAGYLDALRSRRAVFVAAGATASDHGHPSAATADLPCRDAEDLFGRLVGGSRQPGDAELFRAQMLVEMAAMSMEDGLTLQIHAGAWRDHNPTVAARFGPDQGADIPTTADYVGGLKPLLDRFGNEPRLNVIVYTLDETTYSRELAPLAGHYPALRLGPPWWFFDSPEGMRRFYRSVVETAGFANTVGFNDDSRSLLSIPARHDVARRLNAGYLADLVAEHRMEESEAAETAADLALNLACRAFRVDL